jgi:hypothetical protein
MLQAFKNDHKIDLQKKQTMKFLSIEPFIPSGSNFNGSKQFFSKLDSNNNYDAGVI